MTDTLKKKEELSDHTIEIDGEEYHSIRADLCLAMLGKFNFQYFIIDQHYEVELVLTQSDLNSKKTLFEKISYGLNFVYIKKREHILFLTQVKKLIDRI